MFADSFIRLNNVKSMIKYFFFFILLVWGCFSLKAQQTAVQNDTVEVASYDCYISQTKQKLRKKLFASTSPLYLRVNNSDYVFGTLQFGKRKGKIYMYLQILDKNVCIKRDKVLDVFFKNGEVVTYKNDFDLNCDGYFAKQMKKNEVQKLVENEILQMKIYTYNKNYELFVSEVQNIDIDTQLSCLQVYKVKKSDEVKVKKEKKNQESRAENQEEKKE